MDQRGNVLEQLRTGGEQGWARFARLFTPVLFQWARQLGLPEADAADVVHELLAAVHEKLPELDGTKSFKSWLHLLALARWRERKRRTAVLTDKPGNETPRDAAVPKEDAQFWEVDYQQLLLQGAVRLVRPEFPAQVWRACWEQVLKRTPATEVAKQTGLSVDMVFAARSRVLRRIRREVDGLV